MKEEKIVKQIVEQPSKPQKKMIPKKWYELIPKEYRTNFLDGLDYYLSAWNERYNKRKAKGSHPVVRKYESMLETKEILEAME